MADVSGVQGEREVTRTSVTLDEDELKRIDMAASIDTRGNRSAFMVKHALAAAEAILERKGIRVA